MKRGVNGTVDSPNMHIRTEASPFTATFPLLRLREELGGNLVLWQFPIYETVVMV